MTDTQRLYYAYTRDTVHKQTHQRECKEEPPHPSKYTVNSLTSHKTKHPFLFPCVCACVRVLVSAGGIGLSQMGSSLFG